jgi:hypothetical protein
MIEAYTVGITLALDNGVSEGLATIRHDLNALNRVLDDSTIGLKRLKDITDRLKLGSKWYLATPDRSGSPTSFPDPAATRASVASPLIELTPRKSNERSSLLPESRSDTLSRTTPPIASGPDRPGQPRIPLATAPWEPPKAPSSRPLSTMVAERGTESGQSSVVPSEVLDRIQSWLARPARVPSSATPHLSQSIDIGALTLPTTLASERKQSQQAAPDQAAGTPLQPTSYLPSLSTRLSPDAALRHPSVAFGDPRVLPIQGQPGSQIASLPSAVPPPAEPQRAALQGDVYLDGSRLGRWIVNHLAKAAERPRAGATGFDPRLTATWPGAPIGT